MTNENTVDLGRCRASDLHHEVTLLEVLSDFRGNLDGHITRPAEWTLVRKETAVRVQKEERFPFKLRFVEVADRLLLLRINLENGLLALVVKTIQHAPGFHQTMCLVDVSSGEIRLVGKNQRVLAVHISFIEILRSAKREHTMYEREVWPQFGPCTNNNQFSIGIGFFNDLGNCS